MLALRVFLFFAYFFGLGIGVPALIVAGVQAKYGLIDAPPPPSTSPWLIEDGRFVYAPRVLGSGATPIDMRTMFPFATAAALVANRDRTIIIAVQAGSASDVERAAAAIGSQYQIAIPAGADARIGPEGFWHGRVLRDDQRLLVVLGPDDESVERRLAMTAGLGVAAPAAIAADAAGERIKQFTKYGIFIWAGLQFFIFGRVASWAGGTPAVPGTTPVPAETVMTRLLDLNRQDLPYTVSRGSRPNEIVIDWRYADAKWLDLMRVHGMRSAYRLVLRLDPGQHNARAQDRFAALEWSAGRGPNLANLKWQASRGITFYQYDHQRVFGLQFRDGKPTFDLSYAYTFNLNELKQPVIDIVRQAGWNYRPVITFFRPVGG